MPHRFTKATRVEWNGEVGRRTVQGWDFGSVDIHSSRFALFPIFILYAWSVVFLLKSERHRLPLYTFPPSTCIEEFNRCAEGYWGVCASKKRSGGEKRTKSFIPFGDGEWDSTSWNESALHFTCLLHLLRVRNASL